MVADLRDFLASGRSLLLAASAPTPSMREVAEHCGVTLADHGSMVVDHVSYDTRLGGIHEVVVSGEYHGAASIVSEGTRAAPLLFSGLGAVVKPKSKVALPAVTAAASAYTTGGKGGHGGQAIALVSVSEGTNGGRAAILGSAEALGNAYFNAGVALPGGQTFAQSGNKAFSRDLLEWVLREKSVLRVSGLKHWKVGGGTQDVYKIKDQLGFSITIEELKGGEWVPFDADDVQVEYRMLDPYVRKTLTSDQKVSSAPGASAHPPPAAPGPADPLSSRAWTRPRPLDARFEVVRSSPRAAIGHNQMLERLSAGQLL